MREKELRLALVCYGGVSLAVYMHGITKEIWKLLRASAARRGVAIDDPRDSEPVYRELLDAIGTTLDLRVICDIVAGASAGGINGIMLAQAISGGHDMEPLRALWLGGADVDELLDAGSASTRYSKLWAMPLVWLARARAAGAGLDVDEAAVRDEVSAKLSRLMRSKWLRTPFSGATFSRMLWDALAAMAAGPRSAPLIPPGQPLDLFVTVTDYHGAPERVRLNSPASILETEHRLVIAFHDGGPREVDGQAERSLGDPAELVFAARATASFPGAFPPLQVGEIDRLVRERGAVWPGRDGFLARVFPRRAAAGLSLDGATLIDGSVLNNRPFGPAIAALGRRPAHREVDRRFVYIDPKPAAAAAVARDETPLVAAGRPPGFLTTLLHSLSDIPREQPIRDNLAAIDELSRRVRRLRYIVDGMAGQVDAAIERTVGVRFFLLPPSPARLADWRARTQSAAARGAGFAFAAYAQLKLAQVVEETATMLIALGGFELREGAAELRARLWIEVRARGAYTIDDGTARDGKRSAYVDFLRRFDLGFRVRRLRFVLRRLNLFAATLADDAARRDFEALKRGLYGLLARYEARRRPEWFGDPVRAAAAAGLDAPAEAMLAYETAIDLRAEDGACDAGLVALLGAVRARDVRRAALRAYLGYPFYDTVLLPLLQGGQGDEFDEIKVDRISPDDATVLRGAGTIKGHRFNAFGAFFSRAYRENDYLWGRIHAADRLIDIVASTLPEGTGLPDLAGLKRRAFRAILDAEREHLTAAPELIAALEREVG